MRDFSSTTLVAGSGATLASVGLAGLVAVVVALAPACPGRPHDGAEGEGPAASEGEGEGVGGEGEGPVTPTPDLALDDTGVAASIHIAFRDFAASDCEVTSQKVGAAGIRAILTFDIDAKNHGDADLVVASGDSHLGASACADADGPALVGFVDYKIAALDGTVAASGTLDVVPLTVAAGASAALGFTASSFVDATDVPAGDYVLELTIDPDGIFDANIADNTVRIPFAAVDMVCHDVACGGRCCPAENCSNDSCTMADLTVDADVLSQSVRIISGFFGDEACDVLEGCAVPGGSRLLNFSTTTPNIGTADLVVGPPDGNPLFHYSACHDHYHFQQYANYRLLTSTGEVAASGHKQAFCLEDLEPFAHNPGDAKYDCNNQGISVGWADTYSRDLDCQWIDVSNVAAGNYVLEVHVNPDRILGESDYTNDVVRVPITIPADPTACQPQDEVCGNGRDESCDGVPDDGCAPLVDNDTCANAHLIDGSGLFQGDITATNASDVSPSCGGAGGDLFFQFDVSTTGIVYLSTYGSDIDTTLSVFRGIACSDEALCVDDACGDANGGAHFLGSMDAGPYTAVVKAKNAGEVGHVQLKLQQGGTNAATLIDAAEMNGDTTSAVNSTAPACVVDDGGGLGPDQLWYFSTCPGPHAASITTCGGGLTFDSVVEVRDGNARGPTFGGACNDDPPEVTNPSKCSDVEPTLQSNGAGDGLWFVVVDGYDTSDAGAYVLRATFQ